MIRTEHSKTHVCHIPYIPGISEESVKTLANHRETSFQTFLHCLHLLFVPHILVLLDQLLLLV